MSTTPNCRTRRAASRSVLAALACVAMLASLAGCTSGSSLPPSDDSSGLELGGGTLPLCGDSHGKPGLTFSTDFVNAGTSVITIDTVLFGSSNNLRVAEARVVPEHNSRGQLSNIDVDTYPPASGRALEWNKTVPVATTPAIMKPGAVDLLVIAAVRSDLTKLGTAKNITVIYTVDKQKRSYVSGDLVLEVRDTYC